MGNCGERKGIAPTRTCDQHQGCIAHRGVLAVPSESLVLPIKPRPLQASTQLSDG